MLHTLLGDYPVTAALKSGAVSSPRLGLRFADVKLPQQAFKRVVRDLEFDLAELALVTFLLARAHDKPYRLLPAVVTARFQHPYLVHDAERGRLSPKELEGRRVGLRSYSVTTAAWVRGMLADDHGVDLAKIRWITFEEPHVAEFRDPPNVQRAPAGKDIKAMLLAGELDAAILGEVPAEPRLRPVIADPEAAAKAWRARTGAIQINHMVVAKRSLEASSVDEFYALLARSRAAAGNPSMNPFGLEPNRRNLEVAIDCVYRQEMIPRRFSVEELFE
ncbi:MAG TPA: phosphate ABC transporter substrate-binding protein [Burkholderiales bacterium]|nr:phosphate ABC transporter substrate-binding protein [Burkholderiales bacterium]